MHPDLLNKDLRDAQYAVRGELYLKADELRKQGREIIFTNGKESAAAAHAEFRRPNLRCPPPPSSPSRQLATPTTWGRSR